MVNERSFYYLKCPMKRLDIDCGSFALIFLRIDFVGLHNFFSRCRWKYNLSDGPKSYKFHSKLQLIHLQCVLHLVRQPIVDFNLGVAKCWYSFNLSACERKVSAPQIFISFIGIAPKITMRHRNFRIVYHDKLYGMSQGLFSIWRLRLQK